MPAKKKNAKSFGLNNRSNKKLTTSRFQAVVVIGLMVVVGSVYFATHAASGIANFTGVVSASTCRPNNSPGIPPGNFGCTITVNGVSVLINSGVYYAKFGQVIDAPPSNISMIGYKVAIHALYTDSAHATLAGSTRYYAKFLGDTIRMTGVAKNSDCVPNLPQHVSPGDFGCSITVKGIDILIRAGQVSYSGGFGMVINAPSGTMDGHLVNIYARQTSPTSATLAGNTSYFAQFIK